MPTGTVEQQWFGFSARYRPTTTPGMERMGRIMAIENTNRTSVQDSDATLVSAAKQANGFAFETLVKRHEAKIFRIVFRITRDKEDAKDVVQQTLHKAFTHLKTFEGESSFSTWLTRIAINQALMLLRKNRRSRAVSLDEVRFVVEKAIPLEVLDSAANPEDKYVQEERGRMLSVAVNRLPPGMRVALRLRLEDRTIGEIAEILGVPSPTVKARLFRARGKLNDLLKIYFKRDSASYRPQFRRATRDVIDAAVRI
ncbi:MAG TPA: sigma-70 family RNA polymerase sigma factor [Candidatus Acidoferrum sp.]